MKIKKIMALVLAVMMVLGLVGTALADDTITISVNTAGQEQVDKNGVYESYDAYQIFSVTKTGSADGNDDNNLGKGEETGYSYSIKSTDEWYPVVSGTGDAAKYFTLTETSVSGTYNVTVKDEYNTAEGAKAIAADLKKNITGKTAKTFGGTETVPTLSTAAGYYLILSSNSSNLILATTDIAITEKATYPTIDKTIEDTVYNIGDTFTYTVTVHVPATAVVGEYIYVTDTLDKHVAYKDTTIAAKVGSTAVTLADLNATDDSGYVVTAATWQKKFAITEAMLDKDVVITYDGELLSESTDDTPNLTAADVAYLNKAYLDYSNYRTPEVEVEVYTLDFNVTKAFTGSTATDTDFQATFELHAGSESGTTLAFTEGTNKYTKVDSTDGDGITTITLKKDQKVNILGLDEGTYYLVETTTQSGYNLLTAPIIVKLTATKDADGKVTGHAASLETGSDELSSLTADTVDISITNNSGTVLPSTGGIGTTIFYVLGAVLVLGAGILLVTKRRMSAE